MPKGPRKGSKRYVCRNEGCDRFGKVQYIPPWADKRCKGCGSEDIEEVTTKVGRRPEAPKTPPPPGLPAEPAATPSAPLTETTVKKVEATAKNLIKSKQDYVVEITINRGEGREFVLPLRPLTVEEHNEIFGGKPPTPPAMLLPKLKDGHIQQGEDKVWRYMEEADLQNPNLDEHARGQWEKYVEKMLNHNKRLNQAMLFAVLPENMKAECDEQYKTRTPENVEKFLNDIFIVGELNSLYAEIYPRVCNAVGVEYGPFSAIDFLKNLETGNPLALD